MKAFRAFHQGVVAIFDEAPGGGEPTQLGALRNRPAADPENWLPNLYFHSSMDMMEVASDDLVTINHGGIDAATGGTTEIPINSNFDVDGTTVDWELKPHGLPYEPLVMVTLDDDVLAPGYPVQIPGTTNGSVRYASAFVTSTRVMLREFRSRGAAGLAAASRTYRVVVFRRAPAPSGNKLIDFVASTGILNMARGRFDSTKRYLQVVPGGSPIGFTVGRTMDAQNGAPRFVAPDATVFDPVPNTVKTAIIASGGEFASDTTVYGAAMNYTGSFAGGLAVQVQAP